MGRSFLEFFYSTLSSSCWVFQDQYWLDFKEAKSSILSCSGPTCMLQISWECSFWAPYALTLLQCHTHGLYLVFIFLWQCCCAHLSKTADHLGNQWSIRVLEITLWVHHGFVVWSAAEGSVPRSSNALIEAAVNSDFCLAFLCLGSMLSKSQVKLPWKSRARQQQKVDYTTKQT